MIRTPIVTVDTAKPSDRNIVY